MIYFIDTNIGIGYSIFPDKHHSKSKSFVNDNLKSLYWSTGVVKELNDKMHDITTNIQNFLLSIVFNVRNRKSDFLNKDEFASFVLKVTKNIDLDIDKKNSLIECFWEKVLGGFSINIAQFPNLLNNFSIYVFNLFDSNRKYLIHEVNYYNCGLNNYKKYNSLSTTLKNIGVHDPDYKFVLDAHDLAKNNSNDVIFTTCDTKMVNAIIDNNILKQLNISNFKVL